MANAQEINEALITFKEKLAGQFEEGDMDALKRSMERLQELQDREQSLAAELKEVKELRRGLEYLGIPTLMEQMNLESLQTSYGRLYVSKMITANIPTKKSIDKEKDPEKKDSLKKRREAAFEWLKDEGEEDQIKNTLTLEFKRTETKKVHDAVKVLKEAGYIPTVTEDVHHLTLNAFAKKRLTEGNGIDMDIFSVFNGNRLKIERE